MPEKERKEREHDDGRNERQRARDDDRARKERAHDDGRSARQRLEEEKQDPEFLARMEEERKRPDFIEHTRPDDPSDRFGQLTRDNVNPDIPSAPPGEGQIVDPNTLGMPQGGIAPPETPPVERRLVDEGVPSINEPPGSQVQPPLEEPAQSVATQPPQEQPDREQREPLPDDNELENMTRAELDELAAHRGLDPDEYANKGEVIAALKKDARKRK